MLGAAYSSLSLFLALMNFSANRRNDLLFWECLNAIQSFMVVGQDFKALENYWKLISSLSCKMNLKKHLGNLSVFEIWCSSKTARLTFSPKEYHKACHRAGTRSTSQDFQVNTIFFYSFVTFILSLVSFTHQNQLVRFKAKPDTEYIWCVPGV